jgi:hypothetical protein
MWDISTPADWTDILAFATITVAWAVFAAAALWPSNVWRSSRK